MHTVVSMVSAAGCFSAHFDMADLVSGVPGGTGNVQDIYPLTPLQESILFPHLAGDRNSCLAAMLMGLDNRARLEAYVGALQAVIERHDILRTAIRWKGRISFSQ